MLSIESCSESRMLAALAISVCLVGILGGCQRPASDTGPTGNADRQADTHEHEDGHEHEDHDTLAEIVPLLEQHRDTVRDAFAENRPEDAHGALHEIEELCQHVRPAGEAAGLSDAQLAELTSAADQLYTAFHQIDEGMHADGEGATYEEVSAVIDASLSTIKQVAGGGDR